MRNHWQKQASRLLKARMVLEGYDNPGLAALLAEKGEKLTARSLGNRISRGNFTFSFFLLCLATMGCEHVRFDIKRQTGDVKKRAAVSKN